MSDIEQRVKKIVAEQLGVNEAEVKTASSFVDDLGALVRCHQSDIYPGEQRKRVARHEPGQHEVQAHRNDEDDQVLVKSA